MTRRVFPWIGLVAVMLAGLWATDVFAQGAGAAVESKRTFFQQWIVDGGWITWFLLIPMSIATMALAIEYCITVRRATIMPELVRTQVQNYFDEKQYREAIDYTAAEPSMFSYMIHSALVEAANGYGAMLRGMEEAMEERQNKLLRHVEWINVIGQIAPMVGLFGTIFGMIKAFGDMANPEKLAGASPVTLAAAGIRTAMVTTFWGLLIAIPALSVFSIFKHRIAAMMAETSLAAQETIGIFKPGASKAAAGAAPARPAPGGEAAARPAPAAPKAR